MNVHRRSFLGLLFIAPVAVQRLLRLPNPTAAVDWIAPERREYYPDGTIVKRYTFVRAKNRIRRDQLVQHAAGSLIGIADEDIAAGQYGWVQIYGPARVKMKVSGVGVYGHTA